MNEKYSKIIDANISTAVENPHYRVDVAAMNLARILSRGDTIKSAAGMFQMKLLRQAITDYSRERGNLTREVVNPFKKEVGIETDANWNLDFSTRTLTIYPVGKKIEVITDDIVVDDAEVNVLEELDINANVYASIIDRLDGAYDESAEDAIAQFIFEQAENARTYERTKQDLQAKYVQPYLETCGITEKVTWSLDFTTKKITITK